jgi:membrane-bound metal-dependent hydrolase YbcI (DUF457 family)
LVEVLLHFVVPFVSLRAVRLGWREVLFTSVIAVIPDLDVLLQVHRSLSHSVIVLLIITLPILAIFRNHKTIRRLTLLAIIGVLIHFALDLFDGYTPFFWPLVNESFKLSTSLNYHVGSAPVIGSTSLLTEPTNFTAPASYDYPIISGNGLAISAVLLLPAFAELLMKRKDLLHWWR